MIPKEINYIWFGDGQLSEFSQNCMATWKKNLPGYKIKKWNEDEYFKIFPEDIFVRRMLKKKKYAFAADYARCRILEKFGGIYLDTDVEIVKSFDDLLFDKLFIGKESLEYTNFAIAGSIPNHPFWGKMYSAVESSKGLKTIPMVANEIFKNPNNEKYFHGVKVYPEIYFYPFNPYSEKSQKQLMYCNVSEETYAIHHWEKNWKLSFFEKLLNKLFN